MDGNRMFAMLESMNYERVSGSDGEKRGAAYLAAQCDAFGLQAQIEEFSVADGDAKATLKVTKPYEKEYEVMGYRRSIPASGRAAIVYAENALKANLADAAGKIVLMNGRINYDNYANLLEAGALCYVTGNGSYRDKTEDADINRPKLRPRLTALHEDKRVSAMNVRMADLLEMLTRGATEAEITLQAEDCELTSRNVTAFIPGTKYPDRIIAFTAHYDTVDYSHGMYDNAAGSAIMMELARYFMANPPKCSLRFVWCGSEEQGLLGSRAFVEAHPDEVAMTHLCVNLDLAGTIAGYDFAIVTGPENFTHYVDMFMKVKGYAVDVKTDTYSSDCISYADYDVPGISLGRFGASGMSAIHDRYDRIELCSAASLASTGRMVEDFVKNMVDAEIFPVERAISPEMRKKVDKYLRKPAKKD